jgi:hypothetical protein
MRLTTLVAFAAAAGLTAALFAASPAEAQSKRRVARAYDPVEVYNGRPSARVTVRRRSFLDPGREPLPNSQHYRDYAVSPAYSIFPRQFDYSSAPGSWSRMPLPGDFDIPGYSRY